MEDALAKENNEDEEISDNECDEANEEIKGKENNKEPVKDENEIKNDNMTKLMLKQREILQNNQLEQKKLVEKVEILNTSADKFRKKFLKDIKKRKLEEE